MSRKELKSPFPYYGGKSRIADVVWARLGCPENYVEPFAGSAAMLLRRPHSGRTEAINDRNHYVANFWRAVQRDPEAVATFADSPVSEADLHARHRYLAVGETAANFRQRIAEDPEFCDAKFAGWWCWGQCCWIGGGWCTDSVGQKRRVMLGQAGHGLVAFGGTEDAEPGLTLKRPVMPADRDTRGVVSYSDGAAKRPMFQCGNSSFGPGVHGEPAERIPVMDTRGFERGVLAYGRPQLGDEIDVGRGVNGHRAAGTCADRRAWLLDWMGRLADRLRLVRICYGHWERICSSNTTMVRLGTCGAFLDPPYAKDIDRLAHWISHLSGECLPPETSGSATNRDGGLYHGDQDQDIDLLVAEVHLWCRKWGADPRVRIALCGYAGEHDALEREGWTVQAWKAHGGYANRNAENQNKHRERVWFSPHCLAERRERTLFDG